MNTTTFLFNKLSRDLAYETILKNSVHVDARTLEPGEREAEFKRKLQEETEEVLAAKNRAELLAELSDVIEVVHGFAKAVGSSYEEIENIRLDKLKDRGGFDRCIFVNKVTYDNESPHYPYLASQPDRYPIVDRT